MYAVSQVKLAASRKPGLVSSTLQIFTSVSKLAITTRPPVESSTGKFTVKGTGTPGLRIVGVVMRMSASDVEQFETTIDKNGKFSITVTLPREGVWLMTYVVDNAGTVVEEGVFDAITYQKDLLPITLSSPLPTTLSGNEIVISGVTMVLIPSISTFYISQKLGNGSFFLIGDAIEGQYVANNLHFAAAIAFILMMILLVFMALLKYVTTRFVYGGD